MTERGAAQPGQATPDALKRTLTEHAAPERLVVARGLFTGPSAQVTDDMYARIVNGRHTGSATRCTWNRARQSTPTPTSAGFLRVTSSGGRLQTRSS